MVQQVALQMPVLFHKLLCSGILPPHIRTTFAANYVTIPDDDQDIILEAKQSLLLSNLEARQKRNTDKLSDITMGS